MSRRDAQNPDLGRTVLRRHEQHRDRWSSFGSRTGIVEISERPSPAELARFEIFQGYDDGFLEKVSPDLAICRWEAEAVLFEEGTYIDLAFYVAEGTVEVYLAKQGAAPAGERPIFDVQRTVMWGAAEAAQAVAAAAAAAEGDATAGGRPRQPISRTMLASDLAAAGGITFLAAMDFDLPFGGAMRLGPGELLGEIGAMSGWPQSVTARTATPCTLVQIRLPALRALRRRSPAFKERLDEIYRRLSLADQLKATPLFAGCDPEVVEQLKDDVELVSCEPGEEIAREGEPADALYLVRSGFLQLAQRLGAGELVVNYLSKGMTLGEVELLVGDTGGWTVSASSVEHAELVRIPRERFAAIRRRLPAVEGRLWKTAVARVKEAGFSRRNMGHSEFIKTALDSGLVQGNAVLVIDLERCTRCDDCVRACAATHQGRPRFVREGDKYGNLQIASACYHCRDPVCLVGCPTGAIRRTGVGAVVAIDENLCIGCTSCARACPYDAIVMHETGETWPDDMVPESLRGRERLVASKCDLCHTRSDGPACVKNCPNGCAYRLGSLEEFEELLA